MTNTRILLVSLLVILAGIVFAQDDFGYNGNNTTRKTFYGIIDFTGAEVVPCEHKGRLVIINDLVYEITPEMKFFVMNLKGERLLDMEFNNIPIFVNGYAYIVKDDKLGCININGSIAVPFEYDSDYNFDVNIYCLHRGFLILKKGDKYGVVNLRNEIIMPFEYEDIDVSEDYNQRKDDVLRVKKDGKIGYFTINGEELVPPKYDDGNFYTNGFATVKIGDKYTVLDIHGNELFAPVGGYDFMYAINSKFIIVMKKDKIGFINISGKEVCPCVLTFFKTNSKDLEWINRKYKDPKERFEAERKLAIETIEKDYSPLIRFYKDNKPCFINEEGKIGLFPNVYDAEKFVDNRCIFTVIDGFEVNLDMLYNKAGTNIKFKNIKDAYEYVKNIPEKDIDSMLKRKAEELSNSFANLQLSGQLGIILDNIDERIFRDQDDPIVHKSSMVCTLDTARVTKGCIFVSPLEYSMTVFNKEFGLDIKYGPDTQRFYLINIITKQGVLVPNGSAIIPPNYDKISPFKDGIAVFSQKGKSGLISKNNQVNFADYKSIGEFSCGLAAVYKEGDNSILKGGYIDNEGNEVIPCIYNRVQKFKDNKARVTIDGTKYGIIDRENNTVLDFKYNTLRISKEGAIIVYQSDEAGFGVINNSGILSSSFYSDIMEQEDINMTDREYEAIFGVKRPIAEKKYLIAIKSF